MGCNGSQNRSRILWGCSGVRKVSDGDRADAAVFPFDEAAEMLSLGAAGPHGEAGYSTLERRWGPSGLFSNPAGDICILYASWSHS